jgi:glycosyltransferase involved in cell wall biosynthesis
MKRVLLLVHCAAHFRELFRVARVLKESSDYEPLLLFHDTYPTTSDDEAACAARQIATYRKVGNQVIPSPIPTRSGKGNSDQAVPKSPAVEQPAERNVADSLHESAPHSRSECSTDPMPTGSLCKRLLRNILPWSLRHHMRMGARTCLRGAYRVAQRFQLHENNVFGWWLRCRRQLQLARRTIEELRVDLLLLAEDNVEYGTGAFLRACRERGVPSVIVPYALAGPEEPAEVYWDQSPHRLHTLSNCFLAWMYPHWVHEHRGRKLVRLPARRALPIEWLKIGQPLPWVMNGSHADVLAVESQFMFNYYQRYGVPAEKMVITGALSDDTLKSHQDEAERTRQELCRELRLDPSKPILLCALPPVHSGSCRWGDDFAGYKEMLACWVDALERTVGWNLVLSLHPSMSYEHWKHLERRRGDRGPRIARRDTAQLVPLCSLYVASISSTIRWAIACGKPVLNYDVYRFGFTDFSSAPGVVTVEEKADFLKALLRFTSDKAYLEEIRARQRSCMHDWGTLDGQSARRLLDLFDQLQERRPSTAPERAAGLIPAERTVGVKSPGENASEPEA